MMPFFYISFCDPGKPKGQQFLGATVVEAADLSGVIAEAWKQSVNPGGEAAIVLLPFKTAGEIPAPGADYLNRFIPREQVLARERIPEPDGDDPDMRCATVCPAHNHS